MAIRSHSKNDDVTLLKQALLKIEQLQAQVDAAGRAAHEPIAVIGMGCRLPGGVANPERFWEKLRDGANLVSETPADRWDADAFYDPTPGVPGKMYSKAGAFLDSVDQFDPQFFGIAPREAKSLDPQQRLLLEVSWEALENAGQSPQKLAGTATGVFFGIGAIDYQALQVHQQDVKLLDTYHASGIAHSVAAGRVSYTLGLTGPSLAIDTACSSSLVAIHYACLSLRGGECRSALAGGVNLMLAPFSNITFSQSSMLSPAGRCATFDAAADGFVQGEGCGVIVLKLLRDALEDGDRIEAVIRGSAVNQDGASSGLTAPNGPAQEAVIRAALSDGGVAAQDVSYVEAHGSGTPLGDPIEVQALASALGKGRPQDEPLIIGSVKTNAGHLATAAGVTGVIKVILAMRAKQIPPHLHYETPNPHIPWAQLPVEVATELTPWQTSDCRRIAGVSGFGFSGTNVHLVIEEAPETTDEAVDSVAATDVPLVLSAKSEAALREMAASYANDLERQADDDLSDVLYTANAGRAQFKHRLLVAGGSPKSLAGSLSDFSSGEVVGGLRSAVLRNPDPPRVAFLFSGIGSEYAGMGRQLYETEPEFRAAIERCDELMKSRLDVPLASILYPDVAAVDAGAALGDERVSYPALFAVEYALASLWRSWGIEPWAVMGHGIGEYVAACVAGALSLEDAIGICAERGRLMHGLEADGAMAVVHGKSEQVYAAVEPLRNSVSVAAINADRHVVISGARPDVQQVCDDLAAQELDSLLLSSTQSLQSPLIDPILDELEEAAQRITISRPAIGIVSGVSGETVSPSQLRQSSYWRSQARETIHFGAAINALRKRDIDVFVEIGPDAVLTGLGANADSAPGGTWLASMRKGGADREQMIGGLGSLYLRGADVDWHHVFGAGQYRKIVLPNYPFERQRYWIDGLAIRAGDAVRQSDGEHPLLGVQIDTPLNAVLFQAEFGLDWTPVLHEHVVHGIVVVPAAAIIEMAIAAGSNYFGSDNFDLLDVSISEALTLQDSGSTQVQFVLTPESNNRAAFQLFSRRSDVGSGDWRAHAAGMLVSPGSAGLQSQIPTEPAADTAARCTTQVDVEQLYRCMWDRGLQFGEKFRGLDRLSRGTGEALGEIMATDTVSDSRYRFDPPVLDACIQVVSAALPDFDPDDAKSDIFMPIGIDRIRVTPNRSAPAISYARLQQAAPQSGETRSADLRISDASGRPLLEFDGLHLKRADASALLQATAGGIGNLLYRIDWQPVADAARIAQPTPDFPTPDAIGARVQSNLEPLCDLHGVGIYEQLSADLDILCASYVVDAFHKLGWSFDVARQTDIDELLSELNIEERHRRLLERLLDILCEEGVLTRSGDAWTVSKAPDLERSAPLAQRLLEKYAGCNSELRWTQACGDKLAEALRGDADPHELLFPAGDMTLATEVYSNTPIAKLFNGLTAEAIASIVAGQPRDQRLNVLEIGAGTGATTEVLLKGLPTERAHYTFSDIGPAFVNQARRRFVDHSNAEFKILDIERDPQEQEFTAGQFDVIVASNVLHATADLRQTIDRVANLLAPGGLLVMLEVTALQRWFDLTVGLTPGWWQFADTDLRPDHPLLTGSGWGTLLGECGFDATTVVPDTLHPAIEQAMIIARKSTAEDVIAEQHDSMPGEEWVILADESGVAAALAEQLDQQGTKYTLVRKAPKYEVADTSTVLLDPRKRVHFDRLLGEVVAQGSGTKRFVYLWALDAGDNQDVSAEELAAEQGEICGGALHLVQALATSAPENARLAIVTRGGQFTAHGRGPVEPAQSTLWGLNKAIGLEHPDLHPLAIDLDPSIAAGVEEAQALVDEVRYRASESEIALRLGNSYASRLVRTPAHPVGQLEPAAPSEKLVLTKPASGLFSDMQLRPDQRQAPQAGEVEIRVLASGLNFRDVLVALDVHHDFDSIGSECAGRVVRVGSDVSHLAPGDEVIAIAPRALATHAVANAHLTVRKPSSMGFRDAVTLPIAFLTADYALNKVGGMSEGDVVLIHAAAGGVGMAALQLARRAGATVIATAGSKSKRRYLRQLGVEHVMSSRTLDFAAGAMEITQGRGVDILLNGLTGEFIDKGLETLAPGGRFLELGKSDVWDADRARAVNAEVDYHVVDLTGDMLNKPQALRPMLEELMQLVERQELSPLPWQSFALDVAADAFQFMEQAQHVGKVVLTQSDSETGSAAGFREDGTYLIIGGLGGLGERVAEWAVEQGARNLVLAGRRDASEESRAKIAALEDKGAAVTVARCDVSREDDVRRLLADIATAMPPLRGVFHSAGVLDDGLLLQQEWGRFEYVMSPKVAGSWSLHKLTRDLPLDFFVLFSSIASVLGGSGAGNHSAANAFLDSLAHLRRRSGMPAMSINWGAWSEIGAAVRDGASQHIASQGLGFITPLQGLESLHAAMDAQLEQIAVMSMDWPEFFARDPNQRHRPLLSAVVADTRHGGATAVTSGDGPFEAESDFVERLAAAYPNKRLAMIEDQVATCAGGVLGLDAASIDPQQPLSDMGMDSLMAVELRNSLRRSIGEQLPATLLFDYPTIDSLSEYLAREVLAVDEAEKLPEVSADVDLLDSIENLSDEEVDRAFGEQVERR